MRSSVHVRSCACEKGKRWEAAHCIAAGDGAAVADPGCCGPECSCQCIREGPAMEEGASVDYIRCRELGCIHELLTLNAVSCSASLDTCEAGKQWERALGSLQEMVH